MTHRILIWGYGRLGRALLKGFVDFRNANGHWPMGAERCIVVGRAKDRVSVFPDQHVEY